MNLSHFTVYFKLYFTANKGEFRKKLNQRCIQCIFISAYSYFSHFKLWTILSFQFVKIIKFLF